MATLPDKLTLEISRWLKTRPQVTASSLAAARSMAILDFCIWSEPTRQPLDVVWQRFIAAIDLCGWSICRLRHADESEPFRLREKPAKEPKARKRRPSLALYGGE